MDTTLSGIDVAELEYLLQAADPAVLLLPPRLLRRIIKHDRGVTGLGLQVPHRRSYVTGCDNLLQIVDRQELGLAPDTELPATVILIARPDAGGLASTPRGVTLVKYWRTLFHARVHVAIEERFAGGAITEAGYRERIQVIGQADFEEIRAVLLQDGYLLPPRDDRTVYTEFAAVFLELRYFATALLPSYFPALDGLGRVDELLALDVDAEGLFAATRPAGAPDPVIMPDRAADEDEAEPEEEEALSAGQPSLGWLGTLVWWWQRIWKPGAVADPAFALFRQLMRRAKRATRRGNAVRAIVSRTLAIAVAPVGRQEEVRAEANADLEHLAGRLQAAVGVDSQSASQWRRALAPLLAPAARGFWPVEARLLYDLQKVCLDHERELYAIDLIDWVLWLGRRPLKRALPRQREILLLRHLRSAARRLRAARLDEASRKRLSSLLRAAIQHAERRVRDGFRPVIRDSLTAVGMRPANLPEWVALNKLVEELLDRIDDRGFATLGDLRDAVSRNNLKLPDLGAGDEPERPHGWAPGVRMRRLVSGLEEFILGDRLIRADRRLAFVLDGVYHRGEIYLRWLQRLSSLAFGTRLGRFLTRYLALPYGGAFVVLEGVQEIINVVLEWLTGSKIHLMLYRAVLEAGPADHRVQYRVSLSVLMLGTVLLGVLHVEAFRRLLGRALWLLYRAARGLLIDLPVLLLRLPLVRRVLDSSPFVVFRRYVLKPLVLAAATGIGLRLGGADTASAAMNGAAVFVATSLFLYTRLGRDIEEAVTDWAVRTWQRIHFDLLPGLFRLVMGVFRRLVESVDRFLYRVDEWLRFRGGDGRLAQVVKPVLGLFWFCISYVVRIYVNLFIEPTFNPIKHFPVVTVTAKLMLPFYPKLKNFIAGPLTPLVGRIAAPTLAWMNVGLVPGVCGFVVWELKENWRLYKANRPRVVQPVTIGHHGETMVRLLRPGFHSGTVPKLYAKLRRAERAAQRTGDWRAAHKHHEALRHVGERVRHFVEREFAVLLNHSRRWGRMAVSAGEVRLGTNRIRLELLCADQSDPAVVLDLEVHAAWLVAGIAETGWLPHLAPEQARALATALAGLYKFAGVDLVREQIEAGLGIDARSYSIAAEGLVIHPGTSSGPAIVYDLRDGRLPRAAAGERLLPESAALILRNIPVSWQRWIEVWQEDQAGESHVKPLLPGVALLPSRT